MGLLRLILLAILGALLYRSWRRWRERRLALARAKPRDQGHMVACRQCGLYLPQPDALRDGDDFYCSEAHRRARRAGPNG